MAYRGRCVLIGTAVGVFVPMWAEKVLEISMHAFHGAVVALGTSEVKSLGQLLCAIILVDGKSQQNFGPTEVHGPHCWYMLWLVLD